jgi:hypothetical protein
VATVDEGEFYILSPYQGRVVWCGPNGWCDAREPWLITFDGWPYLQRAHARRVITLMRRRKRMSFAAAQRWKMAHIVSRAEVIENES